MIKLSTVALLALVLSVIHMDVFAQENHSQEEEHSFIEYRLASWGNWIFRSLKPTMLQPGG